MIRKTWIVFTCIMATVALSLFFSSCAGLNPTPPELSVCNGIDSEDSWICTVASKYNLTPEDFDSILLDANTVAIIAGAYNREQARKVILKLIDNVETRELSYTGLIEIVLKDTDKADLLDQMISRHLTFFK